MAAVARLRDMARGWGFWNLLLNIYGKCRLWTLKEQSWICTMIDSRHLPSTTLMTAPSLRPSILLSSAKLSKMFPSSCSEKHVLWHVSSRSIMTWWISWTISCGLTWEKRGRNKDLISIIHIHSSFAYKTITMLPSRFSEKQVLGQVSSRSIITWCISWTISCRLIN